MTTSPVQLALLNDPKAPEFFASYLAGAGFDGPNVRLAFVSARATHDAKNPNVDHVVSNRIVMSVESAKQMCVFLSNFLNGAELNATQKPPEQPLQ